MDTQQATSALGEPAQASQPPMEPDDTQWKPTAFERRVEARLARKQEPAELTDPGDSPAGEAPAETGPTPAESSVSKALRLFQEAGLQDDPEALQLVSELANVALRQASPPSSRRGGPAKASHVIQPSGGGLPPAPDLRAEYERRVGTLRPGDVAGLMDLKREFRQRGLEIF